MHSKTLSKMGICNLSSSFYVIQSIHIYGIHIMMTYVENITASSVYSVTRYISHFYEVS